MNNSIHALKFLKKFLIRLSSYVAGWAFEIWRLSTKIDNIIMKKSFQLNSLTQWKNRLLEFCLSEEEVKNFWGLIDNGIAPYHAFNMVIESTNNEN